MRNEPNRDDNREHAIPHVKILQLLDREPDLEFSLRHIAKHVGIHNKDIKDVLLPELEMMAKTGKIRRTDKVSFQSALRPTEKIGVVDMASQKFSFVILPTDEPDIIVFPENLNYAQHGDKVRVRVYSGGGRNRREEGTVLEILERNSKPVVGKLIIGDDYPRVQPDNKKLKEDILIAPENLNQATDGDKVLVKITSWPAKRNANLSGEIIEVLGRAGENETEMHAILAEFGLPRTFPEEVNAAAEKIDDQISEQEIELRRDFRKITTITIDPLTAKDFDDALSLRELENGNFEVGVHIADVSHYVKANSIIDEEARERATSVYLVDRTVPMLPERLSNHLCSLNPKVDRLAFAAVFELDTDANVVKQWFGRTIINSDRRFTYEEAQERIESQKGDFANEILVLNKLAHKLREKRFLKGAVNFETPEVYFELDSNGKPLSVKPKERKEAHMLIEDFMLLANKRVAEYLYTYGARGANNPAVYRIHDSPDVEKLENFGRFVRRLGFKFSLYEGVNISQALNSLMEQIEGEPEGPIIQMLAVRAMAKAKYTTKSTGHFGLAFEHYTHFTSPIRRYPDLLVHRLLAQYLQRTPPRDAEELEEICKHSSEREMLASEAERASIKYKQIEYILMQDTKVFTGMISGLTDWGVFVEIEDNKVEGMIKIGNLGDDFFVFDPERYQIIGRRSGKSYVFGQKVKIEVIDGNLEKRTLEFKLIEEGGGQRRSDNRGGGFDRGRDSNNRSYGNSFNRGRNTSSGKGRGESGGRGGNGGGSGGRGRR